MSSEPFHILFVEDNPVDVCVIEACLGERPGLAKIEFERVARLSEAVERLGARGFDAVLLDLALPDSSGLETFFKVHAEVPHLPIVVLTGMDDEGLALEAVQQGAQDYLVKGNMEGGLLERSLRYAIERKRAEQALAERAAELGRINEMLQREVQELARAEQALDQERRRLMKSLEIQERDRQLVSCEIHDGLVQLITAAKMSLESCQINRAVNPQRTVDLFAQGLDLLDEGIAEARRLIEGLRPPDLELSGVATAIDSLVCRAQRSGGPEIEFHSDIRFERLPAPLETTIFRIVQEALNNALRHSKSDSVRIEMVQQDRSLHILVEDRGVGFSPDEIEVGRFGLRGMRERARLFGGSLDVQTKPGDGTCVLVDLPIPAAVGSADEAGRGGQGGGEMKDEG